MYKKISPAHSLLRIIFSIGVALLIAEYLILGYHLADLAKYPIPSQVYTALDRLMPLVRFGVPWVFFLMVYSYHSSPIIRSKNKKPLPHIPLTVVLIAVGVCIICHGGILSFPMLSVGIWRILYPGVYGLLAVSMSILSLALVTPSPFFITPPRTKVTSKYGFNVKLKGGWLNLTNPFRGILIAAGPGAGKSYSLVEPIIEQAIEKDYAGLIYDFKFPTLTNTAYTALAKTQSGTEIDIINFTDMTRTRRINPLAPKNIPNLIFARKYATTIASNIIPGAGEKYNFWLDSATIILTVTLYYLKKHQPHYCSLPHAVALICSKQFEKMLPVMARDPEIEAGLVSLIVGIEKDASSQIAGQLATLQNALARLNTPEIAWVLSGDDFSLDVNIKENKRILVLGNDPTLSDALAPVLALITNVALDLMNQPGRHHSVVVLDEAPTLYIPHFDKIPATARSNNIATIYVAQDLSQMEKSYGKLGAEAILGTLQSQVFGKASNQKTAEYISSIFGKSEKEVSSLQYGQSYESVSVQDKDTSLIRSKEIIDLRVGEFVGVTAGKMNQWFKGTVIRKRPKEILPLPVLTHSVDLEWNFNQIHSEAKSLITQS